jgi:hypothetical protein
MKPHLYIRAYMAGAAFPTVFLLCIFKVVCVERFVYNVDVPVERLVVPLVLVPNLWGAWNILYVALRRHRRLSLGLHGALLPLLLLPAGLALAYRLAPGLSHVPPAVFALALPGLMVIYYLLWKYVVRFLNDLAGVEAAAAGSSAGPGNQPASGRDPNWS